MDQHWQGFGYYYSETNRDGHGAHADSHSAPLLEGVHASGSHQRANTYPQRQSSFQPRPPSTGPSPGPNGSPHHLPPFAQFYPQHYQPTQSPTQGSHSSAFSHPYVPSTSPATAYSYHSGSHILSPASASGSRAPHPPPPPHSYPPPQALGTSFANYSTSPHPRQLSPPSPAPRAPPGHSKRRSHSASYSNGSWDDDGGKHGDGLGETNEKEPWGMPQDEYRALNPRDKKQVRNRIGARRFRAKRKDYVASLEASLQTRNDEIDALRAQLESARSEIAGYRDRLGLPLAGAEDGGLGLQGTR